MKQNILIVIFCIGILPQIFSQNNFGFSFKGGLSLPTGEYSSNNLDEGAFTMVGLSLGADAFWYFYKNLGVVADFSYSLHSVDAPALATETLYASEDPLLNDLYARSDPYKAISILLGLQYNYKLLNKLSIEPKAFMGVMIASTPFQLFETEYFLLGEDYYKKTSSRDESLAYKFGLNFQYDVSACLGLKLMTDYTFSKMNFAFNNSAGRYFREQNIGFFDIQMGVVYKLGSSTNDVLN